MAVYTTFKNLQDRVLDLISKSDATTRNRIKNWLNMADADFVQRELWPFRETTTTLTLVAGTQEYSLATYFPSLDTNNIIDVAIQGSGAAKMRYFSYNQLRDYYPDFTTGGLGTPYGYYLKGGKIGFYPSPSAVASVFVDYFKSTTEMVNDSDEPTTPLGYRESLIQYALSMEHDFNTDPDLAVKAMNTYENFVTKARMNLLTQPSDSGNFKILGPADFVNHTDVGYGRGN